ncbi:polysaccharide biosynthesis C-terminal domain-containing protein [Desulfoscipio geothermicus]|uniref:polysaccharide biosynthesis C-terminal domain-containing protein n=1 Tax=Desulfoscipio geothermicus TaxID=39060 RepID=UPI001A96665F
MILILYGEAYRNAAWSLILLIPGVVAWSVSKLLSNTLTYNRNMASFVAKVAVCGCLLNILLNYVFINVILIGINGASIASSLSYFFVALLIGLKTRGVS